MSPNLIRRTCARCSGRLSERPGILGTKHLTLATYLLYGQQAMFILPFASSTGVIQHNVVIGPQQSSSGRTMFYFSMKEYSPNSRYLLCHQLTQHRPPQSFYYNFKFSADKHQFQTAPIINLSRLVKSGRGAPAYRCKPARHLKITRKDEIINWSRKL